MKIGIIYDHAYPWSIGGGEKHLHELATTLARRGHELHYFTMQWWEGPRVIERDGIVYHGVCARHAPTGRAGKRSVVPALRFAAGLFDYFRRALPEGIEFFDVQAFPYFSVPAFAAARRLYARDAAWVLSWFEVLGEAEWKRQLNRGAGIAEWIERLCARIAPHHLCISRHTAGRLRDLLAVGDDRIAVIPRGINVHVLPVDTPAGPKHPHRAIVVGRLVGHKRVDLAVRAWKKVRATIPDAELVIVGDGPERARLAEIARGSGGVSFHPFFADPHDMLRLVAESSVMLIPSLREGQGVVALEAVAVDTAVIGACGPGTAVAEQFPDDVVARAFLATDCGEAEWADRIIELLRDPASRERLVRASAEKLREYDWEKAIVPRYLTLTAKLSAREPRSPNQAAPSLSMSTESR